MFTHFRVKLMVLALILLSQSIFAKETENRSLAPFESISSTASLDIEIVIGSSYAARVESENIDLQKIRTEVNNGVLSISISKGNYWNVRAKVQVTMPKIRSIQQSGSGNISTLSPLEGESLDLQLNSAGNITINLLIVDNLHVRLFGTGDIQLGGSADDAYIKLSGSGDIEAFGLKTLRCRAEIIGAGNIKVLALESIEARVSGSGDITYKGKPFKEKTSSSGPGGIIAIK